MTLENIPFVSIIILNFNGLKHLAPCFDSLRQLDYPKDRLEILFVDNGSSDGSEEFVRQNYPELKIVQNNANLGFAEGNNVGARLARGEIVAFLNNDTRVEPNWLLELVRPLIEDESVTCTASKILDWEGKTIDFVKANINFHGFAHQEAWRMPIEADCYDESCPLLLACGGSMAIDRDIFLKIGGFDKDFFVFYEDVDLGWRLWVLGYKVLFAPKAITYHRHHSTSNKVSEFRRRFLYERNALYMLVKNYENLNMEKIFPAALLLAAHRATDAIQATGHNIKAFHPDNWGSLSNRALNKKVPLGATIPLLAIRDVIDNLPNLMEKRAQIQSQRKRSDQEIFQLFGQPFKMYTMGYHTNANYAIAHHNLIKYFEIDQMFNQFGKKILILSSVPLPFYGCQQSAEATRIEALGATLSNLGHTVIYSIRKSSLSTDTAFPPLAHLAWDPKTIDSEVVKIGPDLLITSDWESLERLNKGSFRPVIFDMTFFEVNAKDDDELRETKKKAIQKSDLFLCETQDQRAGVQKLLENMGIQVEIDNIQTAEFLQKYCLQPRFTGVKPAQPPATPLWKLPIKAWKIIKNLGANALFAEAKLYLHWRYKQSNNILKG